MDSNGRSIGDLPKLAEEAHVKRPDLFPPESHARYEWAPEEEGGGVRRQRPQQGGERSLLQQALGLGPEETQATEFRLEDSAAFNDSSRLLPNAPQKQSKEAYEHWHQKKALPFEVYQRGTLPALDATGSHPLASYSGIYKGMNPLDV